MDVKKCGHSKSDARAANHIFLKSLDCLETLENGYNLKAIMFSAPKLIWPPWPVHLGAENMISFKL